MSPAEAIRLAASCLYDDDNLFDDGMPGHSPIAKYRGVPFHCQGDGEFVASHKDDARLAAGSIPELMLLIRQDEAGRRCR